LEIPRQFPYTASDDARTLPLMPPTAVHPIVGDGNCLFRSLSFALAETERYHQDIRSAICNHIRNHQNEIRFVLPNECNGDVNNYVVNSRMEQNATWGTEVELFAASMLLNVNIFVYSKIGVQWRWIKYSPPNSRLNCGIYLYHKSGNHFEVVLAVENSQIPNCISQDQYYFPVQQNLENVKKTKT
jgi:hypothetical protein